MDLYNKTLWVFITKCVTSIREYTALTYIFCQLLFKKYFTLTKISMLYSVTPQMTHTTGFKRYMNTYKHIALMT